MRVRIRASGPPVVVSVSVARLPGVTEGEEKEQFIPCAMGEEQLSVTSSLNPACETAVSVRVAVSPACTGGKLTGETSNKKSGGVALSCTVIVLLSAVDTRSTKSSPV